MKQYLFLFSIGPVQSFIVQARKTQDLYAGSKILSALAKAGLEAAHPKEYIFPKDPNATSVPNRFLCLIEEDPKAVGKRVEERVKKHWKEVICKDLKTYYNILGIEQQIDSHLDINWAFVEIPSDTEGGYKTAYEKIERLLGAVKNARSFTQFNYQAELGEKGRKCSLDGERNVKFYRLGENEKKADIIAKKLFVSTVEVKIIDYNVEREFNHSSLQPGEGLSAVSMVKRLYNSKKGFPSVAKISLKKELDTIGNKKDILDCFKGLFSNKFPQACLDIANLNLTKKVEIEMNSGIWNTDFDEQFLFDENLTKKRIPNESQLVLAKELQRKLKDNFKQKYYAIIDFDGDNMGKWLSGANINNPEKNLKEFHKKLSEKLANFAKEAEKIVDSYGQTVYAGGDDFLGFVNLNYLFKAMQELRNKFKELVNDDIQKLGYLKNELSFSAGVCIAHYKEPLSMVLAKAAAAQKTAKAEKRGGDRNAFCIVASKHSGENHETYFKWEMDCKNVKLLECVVNQLISKNGFSNTFIKNLNIEFTKLADADGKLHSLGRGLLEAETLRLVQRSFMGKKEDKKEESKKMTTVIMCIYDEAKKFENFINALNICDFLHRLLGTGSDSGALPKTEKELCNAL